MFAEMHKRFVVGTPKIEVPRDMFHLTKTLKPRIINTLTKTGNIATRDKAKVIEIIPGDRLKIISPGQTMDNKIKTHNTEKLLSDIKSKSIPRIQPDEQIGPLISNIENELKKKKEIKKVETKPEYKTLEKISDKDIGEDEIVMKPDGTIGMKSDLATSPNNSKNDLIEVNIKLFEFIDDIFKSYKASPYKFNYNKDRNIKKFMDIYNQGIQNKIFKVKHDENFFENLYLAIGSNLNDYFPTPRNLFNDEDLKAIISRAENILEPTAGTGHIINSVRDINPNAKITAMELNGTFIKLLESFNPDIQVIQGNFLEHDFTNPKYDLIIINPPFTFGGDSRFYLRFLFKCLYLKNKASNNKVYEPGIIFISPDIINNTQQGQTFDLTSVFKYMSKENIKRTLKDYNINITDKEISQLKTGDFDSDKLMEINDMFDIKQGQVIKRQFKGFGGTNASANVYYIL